MAARFYGRNRATKDIDILVESSGSNCLRVKKALLSLKYSVNGLNENDFENYEYIRVGGKTIIDLHSSYLGVTFSDVEINWFQYNSVNIPVVAKKHLLKLMSLTGVNGEDIRILKLLDDPVKNAKEINDSQ